MTNREGFSRDNLQSERINRIDELYAELDKLEDMSATTIKEKDPGAFYGKTDMEIEEYLEKRREEIRQAIDRLEEKGH